MIIVGTGHELEGQTYDHAFDRTVAFEDMSSDEVSLTNVLTVGGKVNGFMPEEHRSVDADEGLNVAEHEKVMVAFDSRLDVCDPRGVDGHLQ